MALRDFLFGFKFLATDYVSPVLKNIENRIEGVNQQIKNTSRWREGAANLGVMSAGFLAAGGAVGLGLMATVTAASAMQTEMTHVRTAMNDGAATALNLAQAQGMAEKTAIATGLGAIKVAQAYYIARSNMLDHAQALAAVNTATKLTIGTTASLADAQTQLEPTTRLLTSIYQNFGSKLGDPNKQISNFADTLAKLQTQYSFRDIGEVNEALSYATPLAKSAGVAFNDMNAALAVLSVSQKHGAEAGTAFAEMIQKMSTESKLRGIVAHTAAGGIDLGRTLDRLRVQTQGLGDSQKAMYFHQIGFTERSIVGVSLMMDKMELYHSALNDLNNAQGANAAAFNVRQASMEIATGRLTAAWDVFKSKIGENLLGPMTSFTTKLTEAVSQMTAFVAHHPLITKFVVTFAALGAAIAIVAGGALALAAGLMAAASFIGVGGGIVAVLAGIGAAIAGVTAYLYTWHPAILGMIGSVVKDVGSVLLNLGKFVYEFFTGQWKTMWTDAGLNIVKALADGIWNSINLLAAPVNAIAGKIMSYLPRSPAKEGPLRGLHQVRIIEELSRSIQPYPALSAIRRTAAAVAIAAPMVLSPMMSGPAMAGSSGGARGGGITIQVHQEIHIDGAIAGDEHKLMATLRHHSEELAQIIDARLAHRSRRGF